MPDHGARGRRPDRRRGGRFFADEAAEGRGWPGSVEDAISDIAGVFHWSREELLRLSLSELIEERERAVAWWNRVHAPPKKD
ncbi:GpE family phage tail protein [Brevundimonas intermedia]|uniref:GpE family phage tail protein n=1 Tax=Brevundimonas intermedia TaxID=74315 RepID=UPI0028529E42|nr:GpE family phage tail protein [Brevundimonas intermedia]